jgi:molybdate transport system substrate-binding protein
MRRFAWGIGAALLAWLSAGAGISAQAAGPLVFAAASLKEALDAVLAASGTGAQASYAGSSALARQIEAGAPAALFISADEDWMDYVEQHNLLQPGSRIDLLGNRLVLIAPVASTVSVQLLPGVDLRPALAPAGRLALADVAAVPAGKYAKAALTALQGWPMVADHVVAAENVRAALALVARAEAPLGVVYATDAAAEAKVRVVDVFPENSHPPIIYPAAVLAGAPDQAAATELLAFLRSPWAGALFRDHGFSTR